MKKLDLFIGPCIIESEKMAVEIAETLKIDLGEYEDKINLHFKASFDKANRTSINSFRGPGFDEGLRILKIVKEKTKLPLLVDFHYPEQAEAMSDVVDILQIPAFLCRQTDMVIAGAKSMKKSGGKLNIKKGQFLSPLETKNIIEKAENFLSTENIYLTERGTSFGYNNLIVDMASFSIIKSFNVSTIYDATHSLQMPGGAGTYTAGKRDQFVVLAKAAIAAGADGIFLEAHPNPDEAKSDKTTCIDLKKVKKFVEIILPLWNIAQRLPKDLGE